MVCDVENMFEEYISNHVNEADEEYAKNHEHDEEFIWYDGVVRFGKFDIITLVEVEYFSKYFGIKKLEFYSHNKELCSYDTAEEWVRNNVLPHDARIMYFSIHTSELLDR